MYPNIKPSLKIKNTISHPLRPEEVIGFRGRNTMLGRLAIIMKKDAIQEETVTVPSEPSAALLDEDAELVVLDDNNVLTMEASDFASDREVRDITGRGKAATISTISYLSEKFRCWDNSNVEVGN